jgi:2,3-bisphosphoglycerate-dependent phosphoglycerate mutase
MGYLVIVRHGQSQANIDGLIAGDLDTPLTEEGRMEARKIAVLLQDIHFDAVHCSSLQRARQTLEEIMGILHLPIEPVFHSNLRERSWGILEGKYSDNRNADFTSEQRALWQTFNAPVPGGESYADVSKRAVHYFDKYVLPQLKEGQNVLLVSHNSTLKTLQRYLEKLPENQVHALELWNAEAKIYRFENDAINLVEVRSIHKN